MDKNKMTKVHSHPSSITELLINASNLVNKHNFLLAINVYLDIQKEYGDSAYLFGAIAFCWFTATDYKQTDAEGYKKAIYWIKKSIEIDPYNPEWHTIAGVYYVHGLVDYENAIKSVRKALEINPNYLSALYAAISLAQVPENVLSMDEAIEWLERAISIDSKPITRYWLGKYYLKIGRHEDAIDQWQKAMLSPELDMQTRDTIYTGLEQEESQRMD